MKKRIRALIVVWAFVVMSLCALAACGKKDKRPTSDDVFVYEYRTEFVNNDGSNYNGEPEYAVIVGVTDKSITEVTIPAKFGDYEVIVQTGAFEGCDKLTTVVVESGVYKLENDALAGAPIKNLTLPNDKKGTEIVDGALIGITRGVNVSNLFSYLNELDTLTTGKTPSNGVKVKNLIYTVPGEAGNYVDGEYIESVTLPAGSNIKELSKWTNLQKLCVPSFADYFAMFDEETIAYITGNNGDYPLIQGATLYVDGAAVTDFVMSADMTEIPAYAFTGYKGLKSVEITRGQVGEMAFALCDSLTSITIGNAVTDLGKQAFAGDVSVDNIVFNAENMQDYEVSVDYHKRRDGNHPFGVAEYNQEVYYTGEKSDGISVTIGEDVKNLPALLVVSSQDPDLINVGEKWGIDLPNCIVDITEINYNATSCADIDSGNLQFYNPRTDEKFDTVYGMFRGAAGKINIGDKVERLPANLFRGAKHGEIDFADSELPLTVGDAAFSDCGLTAITVPERTVAIGNESFRNCYGITELILPMQLASVGDYAFAGCYNIKTFDFEETLLGDKGISVDQSKLPALTVGDYAFLNCESITRLEFRERLKSIGMGAFNNTYAVSHIGFSGNVDIDGDAFVYSGKYGNERYYGIYLDIGQNMLKLNGFKNSYVQEVKATYDAVSGRPYQVTEIADDCFNGCVLLSRFNLSDEVRIEKIGDRAFKGCVNLFKFKASSSLKSIGTDAFDGCEKLVEVYDRTDFNLTAGNSGYGKIAYYAKNITKPDEYNFEVGTNLAAAQGYLLYIDGWNASSTTAYYILGIDSRVTDDDYEMINRAVHINLPNFTGGKPYEIYKYAFAYRDDLTITIPASVTKIYSSSFVGCSSLGIRCVAASKPSGWENNWQGGARSVSWNCNVDDLATYERIDGVWYALYDNKTAKVVVQSNSVAGEVSLAADGKIVIPSSVAKEERLEGGIVNKINYAVTSMAGDAFKGNRFITELTLPENIEVEGDFSLEGCVSLKKVNVPATVTSLKGTFVTDYRGTKVTSYGGAFADCRNLTSVTIPDSVTSIGSGVFAGCSALTDISIPDSVTEIGKGAFYGCENIKSIAIPQSDLQSVFFSVPSSLEKVTVKADYITERAFYGCGGLREIVLSDSLTGIGADAFTGCVALRYNMYDNACYLGSVSNPYIALIKAADTSVTECKIHESTKIIYDKAFRDCKSLVSVILPNGLLALGYEAFYNCSSLSGITVPSSVTSIGERAVDVGSTAYVIRCEAAEKPSDWNDRWLYDTGKPIIWDCKNNDLASDGCYYAEINGLAYSLKDGAATVLVQHRLSGEITVPSSVTYKGGSYAVTSIVSLAFADQTDITSVTVSEGVTSIGGGAFIRCTGLARVVLPNSVTALEWNTFLRCTNLENVTLPNGLTSIGDGTFNGCVKLTSIVIPNGVTSIGQEAFYCCYGLKSVTIPKTVTTIGTSAFRQCTRLSDVTYLGAKAEFDAIDRGDWCFSGTPDFIYHFTDGDIKS